MPVLLAPSIAIARSSGIKPEVTIEAEYGFDVWEGRRYTAAHHQPSGPYRGRHEGGTRPAPCNDPDIPEVSEGGVVGISHIDLDTVGGVLRALGADYGVFDPSSAPFWAVAEFVDTNGPHRLPKDSPVRPQMEAWWAWLQANRFKLDFTRINEVDDFITKAAAALCGILNEGHEQHEALMSAGRAWAEAQAALNKDSLKAFIALPNGYTVAVRKAETFTNHLYDTPSGTLIADVVVGLRTDFHSITVSLEDSGKDSGLSARQLVQAIWPDVSAIVGEDEDGAPARRTFGSPQAAIAALHGGEEADVKLLSGGQNGAAGGPRGVPRNDRDLWHAVQVLVEVVGSLPTRPRGA
jgi:hypothetical protein